MSNKLIYGTMHKGDKGIIHKLDNCDSKDILSRICIIREVDCNGQYYVMIPDTSYQHLLMWSWQVQPIEQLTLSQYIKRRRK